jgi:pyruvate dehydrogenase E2 component (dihydrolipoamide acetyltransferase)
MAEAIRMPRMSDTMTEGVIVEWHKKVGDKIKPGDELADVETDKATMPLESYSEGEILYIGPKKGEAAPVNSIVAVVGKKGEDYKSILEKDGAAIAESKPAASGKPIPPPAETAQSAAAELPKGVKIINMPLMSDTMTEGKILKWNKKVGDKVKSDDALAEVETDKATMDVVGYEEGTLLYIAVPAGSAAPINNMIALIGPAGTDVTAYVEAQKNKPRTPSVTEEKKTETHPAVAASPEPTQEHQEALSDGRLKASPLARKMAGEKNIDLSLVTGTGDGGRIIRRDIENYKPAIQPAAAKAAEKESALHMHTFAPIGRESYQDVPNTQMRKTIARRLSESKFQAPHFYLTMEINMDNAMKARKAMNEVSPVKISFNDLVIKACAMALREHPDVNSSWMGDFIRQNNHIHIGSAVAMPEGLIVPVIRFADQKSLSQIAAEAKTLYQKARDKKLQPNEFSGNTFTISNLGMMDIDEFTAIINPPDSAILAVGKIKEIVVRKGDGFGVTNVMKVTLSCDHRSVDGAKGAAFLQTVKAFLENPVRMLI